jgi:hypothetical protein
MRWCRSCGRRLCGARVAVPGTGPRVYALTTAAARPTGGRRTALTASAGIACNRLLAKLCTDMNKPNGQTRLPADRTAILAFLRPLPVRKVPGIGRVMERLLTELGIHTVGDMVRVTHTHTYMHIVGPPAVRVEDDRPVL